MRELEKQLKPCPLCGGRAMVESCETSRSGTFLRHTIVCVECGLTLEWEQEFIIATKQTITGQEITTARVVRNCDVLTAWNRRDDR